MDPREGSTRFHHGSVLGLLHTLHRRVRVRLQPANKLHKSTPLHCNGQTDGRTDRRDAGGDITSSTVQMDPIDGTT